MPTFPHSDAYTQITVDPQTSTDNWETLREVEVQDWQAAFMRLKNENVNGNSVDFRVLASLDYGDNFDVTLKASTTLTSGATNTVEVTEAVSDIRVEITSSSNGTPDDVSAKVALQRMLS